MPTYRVCGLTIVSDDIALDGYAELLAGSAERPAGGAQIERRIVLRLDPGPAPEHAVRHRIAQNGHTFLSAGSDRSRWFIRADELATFSIAKDDSEVVCHPEATCDPTVLPQTFVDRIVPHILDARGHMALHASAVAFAGLGAAGFLGGPGAGKSTLSAGLCPPCTFVTDDCLAMVMADDTVTVHPSYPFARLHGVAADTLLTAESIDVVRTRTQKRRAPRAAATSQQLLALYVLQRGDGSPQITKMRSRDAIVELARHLYRVDPTDRVRLMQELERLERLARTVPVRGLRYPRRIELLGAVGDAIAADLEGLANTRSKTRTTP